MLDIPQATTNAPPALTFTNTMRNQDKRNKPQHSSTSSSTPWPAHPRASCVLRDAPSSSVTSSCIPHNPHTDYTHLHHAAHVQRKLPHHMTGSPENAGHTSRDAPDTADPLCEHSDAIPTMTPRPDPSSKYKALPRNATKTLKRHESTNNIHSQPCSEFQNPQESRTFVQPHLQPAAKDRSSLHSSVHASLLRDVLVHAAKPPARPLMRTKDT